MYVQMKLEEIAFSLSYQSLKFMPEFEVRVRVLKRLKYLGDEDQLKLKGKYASRNMYIVINITRRLKYSNYCSMIRHI